MKKKKYWMYICHDECPVCGSGEDYRERRYTKKPKKWEERHKFGVAYDWCNM